MVTILQYGDIHSAVGTAEILPPEASLFSSSSGSPDHRPASASGFPEGLPHRGSGRRRSGNSSPTAPPSSGRPALHPPGSSSAWKRWAGRFQRGPDLADAHPPLLKHLEKLHPVGIGQRLHDLDEFLHGLSPYIPDRNIVAEDPLVKKKLSTYSLTAPGLQVSSI